MIDTPAPVETDFFARLRVQDAVFSAGLPATLAQLATHREAALPMPSPATSSELQRQLHTLAGCAATFGYRRLGQEARALEQRLRVLQAFDDVPEVDWTEWFAQLHAMLAWASIDPCRSGIARAGAAALQLPG